jgi:hypothetical protein
MTIDAQSRIEKVKNFSADECDRGLHIDGLQVTVRKAIHRRLRILKFAERSTTHESR